MALRQLVLTSLAILALSGTWQVAHATVITIPQSALIPSTTYYTDSIGGGIGSVVVTTGGGNAAKGTSQHYLAVFLGRR